MTLNLIEWFFCNPEFNSKGSLRGAPGWLSPLNLLLLGSWDPALQQVPRSAGSPLVPLSLPVLPLSALSLSLK